MNSKHDHQNRIAVFAALFSFCLTFSPATLTWALAPLNATPPSETSQAQEPASATTTEDAAPAPEAQTPQTPQKEQILIIHPKPADEAAPGQEKPKP